MDPSLLMLTGSSQYGSTLNSDLMMAPFLNQYQNLVSAQDSLSTLDSDIMSMNGSIIPGFSGSFDYDSFYKNLEKNQEYMSDSQIRQNQNWRNVSFLSNSPYTAIRKQVRTLRTKIIENEQEQIMDAFEALKEAVRQAYDADGTADEAQIISQAEQEYYNVYKKELVEDIKTYGNGSLKQGFLQTVTLGIADGTSAEENVANITGQPVGRKQYIYKKIGNATGGAVLGTIGCFVLSKLGSAAKLFKSKPLISAIIGAIGGAIAGSALSSSHS